MSEGEGVEKYLARADAGSQYQAVGQSARIEGPTYRLESTFLPVEARRRSHLEGDARMSERPRRMESVARQALASFRVVVVTGPRQAGKTTLVRRTLGGSDTIAYLDEEATLEASLTDPAAFAAFTSTA